jgi:hypothetical protein
MKFTLKMEDGAHKVEHTFETYGHDEFSEYAKDFLQGCGFVIKEEEKEKEKEKEEDEEIEF